MQFISYYLLKSNLITAFIQDIAVYSGIMYLDVYRCVNLVIRKFTHEIKWNDQNKESLLYSLSIIKNAGFNSRVYFSKLFNIIGAFYSHF